MFTPYHLSTTFTPRFRANARTSQAWAIEIHNAVAAPLWNGLKSGLAALQNQFAGAAMATLTAARKEIYEFIYKNSPPSVRAAIGTLNDAVLADQSANAIKDELFATAPGKAFVAARDKFRQSAMAVLTNVGQLALGMAATVAAAPTGLGALISQQYV